MSDSLNPRPRIVSVIIPTLCRPDLLRRAVTACLAQDLPPGWDLEVLVAVSDPGIREDMLAARQLADMDGRVVPVPARARGAGAARNAGVEASTGEVIAFTDDDCEPTPGWLTAALQALTDADIVQGKTWPGEPASRFDHSIWAVPPTWLWETCNLVVSRPFVLAAGAFNESWNSEGKVGHQYGEDIEWGWRVIRAGARPAFVPAALVHHVVTRRSFRDYLGYRWRSHAFPRIFRTTPEARRRFFMGYFLYRRHVFLTASAGAATGAVIARWWRRRGLSRALGSLALGFYLWPWRRHLIRGDISALGELRYQLPTEVVDFGAALYGTLRWRRLFL